MALTRVEPRRGLVLIPLLAGVLGGSLALSMVNTALPQIADELRVPATARAWIVDVYPLALAVSMVGAARAGDRYGRRRVLLIGVSTMAVLNAVAAAATSATLLIVCRGLLGVAGALILAGVVGTIGSLFSGRGLAFANGMWVTTLGAGNALGPVAGGLLTEGPGWRWVFLALVPLAVLTIGLALWLLPESVGQAAGGWEIPSLLWSAAAIGGIVYGLQEATVAPVRGIPCAAAGLGAGTVFVRRQLRLHEPLLQVRLFLRPGFASAFARIVVSAATAAACLYLVSLELQHAQGRTPIEAGFALAPQAVATAVGGLVAPFSVNWLRSRTSTSVALVIQAAGLIAIPLSHTVLPVALVGFGYGAIGTLATTALFEAATAEHAGAAGATQEVGFAIGAGGGVAVFSTIANLGGGTGFAAALVAAGAVTLLTAIR
ncbi:MFS transporter [Amycolatopsis sp. WGS_07]|uniref:MFS transporter n=1 Tax=Amycolatopsis sp. WGS_07 TaxID=3076764 RepID=UPI003872EEA3